MTETSSTRLLYPLCSRLGEHARRAEPACLPSIASALIGLIYLASLRLGRMGRLPREQAARARPSVRERD